MYCMYCIVCIVMYCTVNVLCKAACSPAKLAAGCFNSCQIWCLVFTLDLQSISHTHLSNKARNFILFMYLALWSYFNIVEKFEINTINDNIAPQQMWMKIIITISA